VQVAELRASALRSAAASGRRWSPSPKRRSPSAPCRVAASR